MLQSTNACNVVQALMESVSLLHPQPKVPAELIKFLAKVHSAWHVAIPLLETHVLLFPADTRCFHALAELYRLVQEDDLLYGLWKNKCGLPNLSSLSTTSAHTALPLLTGRR
jgi:transformation/transcription domain-associated protein